MVFELFIRSYRYVRGLSLSLYPDGFRKKLDCPQTYAFTAIKSQFSYAYRRSENCDCAVFAAGATFYSILPIPYSLLPIA